MSKSQHIHSNAADKSTSWSDNFDAVVFLTWSNWKTEPRSNRYHFAMRFARHLPVYFIQPDGSSGELTWEEASPVTIVHVSPVYDYDQAKRLEEFLAERGARRVLAWVYNVHFTEVIDRLHPKYTVFHATEDYAATPERWKVTVSDIRRQLQVMLDRCDRILAVSDGVAASYAAYMQLPSVPYVLPNGCDFEFWHQADAHVFRQHSGPPVALYQGGINDRLDFGMLTSLADLMPDWTFRFCGREVNTGSEWAALKNRANVDYVGEVSPETIAELARGATIGLIPFVNEGLLRRSLPLKAFEYLACGLPVVTVPIDSLDSHPDLFTKAHGATEFAAAMRRLAETRADPDAVEERLNVARLNSYERNFARLSNMLAQDVSSLQGLNTLILYDDGSTHVGTIREHLLAFKSYSRFRPFYMAATGYLAGAAAANPRLDFSPYDAVLIHYSIRISVDGHLSPIVENALMAYGGPKMLFIQDEYDTTDTSLAAIERLGITAVFTNVPEESWELVYPRSRFPDVTLIPTLTGYVPEDPALSKFVTPIPNRACRIGYRGRKLPHHYGELGFDKYRIGADLKDMLQQRGVNVDIEVDDSKRIYGLDWYRFVGSVRATLGTESGSNVFDFDGRLARLAKDHADLDFQEFSKRYLEGIDGKIRMNQISPRVFEAIKLRTALILFEGEYSNVLKPDIHYLVLKKDYSNIWEIVEKLEDTEFLEGLTQRAFDDIVGSGLYSFAAFVADVDREIVREAWTKARCAIFCAPTFAISRRETLSVSSGSSADVLVSNDIVARGDRTRLVLASSQATPRAPEEQGKVLDIGTLLRGRPPIPQAQSVVAKAYEVARWIWRLLPYEVRLRIAARISGSPKVARWLWRLLPYDVRTRIAARISDSPTPAARTGDQHSGSGGQSQ
ncbi:MAG: glycosyltransferase [Burkholderiales bacterium]|nr:glycosyltransferase [Burkholderiales bacterium]